MNAAFLIASSELRDRSRLFLIAAAMAVVPFGAAFAVRENRPLAIAVVATSLAILYACSLAIALGVSTVGRELTEKRLPFLFAKPVSATSIWAGKVAAGLLTAFGVLAIVVLPAYALVHGGWNDMWGAGWKPIVLNALVLIPVLFFGAHAASTMLRSRSALVALDFLMFGVMLTALFTMTRPILLGRGTDVVEKMLIAVGIAVTAVLAIAPVWQIARGRIDLRRNHASLSTAIWSGVAVVMIAAAAYAVWVISPPLSGIRPFTIEQSPSGRWIAVSGQPPNRGSYLATFLLDSTSGRRQRVPTPVGNSHISGDGRTMVWLEPDELWPMRLMSDKHWPPKGTFRVHTQALEEGARPQSTSLTLKDPLRTQLSEDGSRLAVVNMDKLEIYELPSGRLLGVAKGITSSAEWSTVFFAGPSVVRIAQSYRTNQPMRRIQEFDLLRRKVTTIAEWPAVRRSSKPGAYFFINVTPDGSRIYLGEEGKVRDARTGAVLVTLPIQPEVDRPTVMLRDGSTILIRGAKLFHYDAKGTLLPEVPLPAPGMEVRGQVGASKLLLSTSRQEGQPTVALIDLVTGKAGAVLPGYVSGTGWDDAIIPQYTEDATLVAMDAGRKLVLWDLKTGAKRPLPS